MDIIYIIAGTGIVQGFALLGIAGLFFQRARGKVCRCCRERFHEIAFGSCRLCYMYRRTPHPHERSDGTVEYSEPWE